MARRASARRYARAVFEIALEAKKLEKWPSDLSAIVSAVSNTEFKALLESPKVPLDDKARLLAEQLAGVAPLALNLVLLLVMRDRLDIISDIADEYQRLLDSHHGIERAEVMTAVPLDDADKIKLAEHLSALIGRKVVVKSEVAPALIGGFVARVGGKLLDGSIRSKLETLKRELAGAGR